MTRRRKIKYPAFNKYYLIPLALCLVVIITGVIMTFNQVSSFGYAREYKLGQAKADAKIVEYAISGPSVIISGLIMMAFITYFWIKFKRDSKT